jgi:hypothetical protein
MKATSTLHSIILIVSMIVLIVIFGLIVFGKQTKEIEIFFDEIQLMKAKNTFDLLEKSLDTTWHVSTIQAIFDAAEEGVGCKADVFRFDGSFTENEPGYWFSMDPRKKHTATIIEIGDMQIETPYVKLPENDRDSQGNLIANKYNYKTSNGVVIKTKGDREVNPQICIPQDANVANYLKQKFEDYTNIPGSGKPECDDEGRICSVDCKKDSSIEGPAVKHPCSPPTKCCFPKDADISCTTNGVCKNYKRAACKDGDIESARQSFIDPKATDLVKIIYKRAGDADCNEKNIGSHCFCISPEEGADERESADTSIDINGLKTTIIPYSRNIWLSYGSVSNQVVSSVSMGHDRTQINKDIIQTQEIDTSLKEMVKTGWAIVGNAIDLHQDVYNNKLTYISELQMTELVKKRLEQEGLVSSSVQNRACALTNPDAVSKQIIENYVNSIKIPDSSILKNKGAKLYQAAHDVGLNPAFLLALAILEGGKGDSELSHCKNNPFGWGATDSCKGGQCSNNKGCAKNFRSVDEAFKTVSKGLMDKWLGPNPVLKPQRKNLAEMSGSTATGPVYASSNTWAGSVAKIMSQITGARCTPTSKDSNPIITDIQLNINYKKAKGGGPILNRDQGIWLNYDATVKIIETAPEADITQCKRISNKYDKILDKLGDNQINDAIPDAKEFIAAVIQKESRWKENVGVNGNRKGLMGVPIEYAEEYCNLEKNDDKLTEESKQKLLTPEENIKCGAEILLNLMNEFSDRYTTTLKFWLTDKEKIDRAKLALAAYYSGSSGLEHIKATEGTWETAKKDFEQATITYVDTVMNYYEEYKNNCGFLDFNWPVEGSVSRCFDETNNKGIFITSKTNRDVKAIADGTVIKVGELMPGYKYVKIKHSTSDIIFSIYQPLKDVPIQIKKGAEIEKGERIGKLASDEFYFKIQHFADNVNPCQLFPKECTQGNVKCDTSGDLNLRMAPDIVAIAEKEVGKSEDSRGCVEYFNVCVDWCAYFATWVYQQGGIDIPKIGGAVNLFNWFKKNGQAFEVKKEPDLSGAQPGDMIFWSRGGGFGHVGIVTENTGNELTVIDGNWGDKVDKTTREYNYWFHRKNMKKILGFARTNQQVSYVQRKARLTGIHYREQDGWFTKQPIVLKFKLNDWLPVVDCNNKKDQNRQFRFKGKDKICEKITKKDGSKVWIVKDV